MNNFNFDRISAGVGNIGRAMGKVGKDIKNYVEGKSSSNIDSRFDRALSAPRKQEVGADGVVRELETKEKALNAAFGTVITPVRLAKEAVVFIYNKSLEKYTELKNAETDTNEELKNELEGQIHNLQVQLEMGSQEIKVAYREGVYLTANRDEAKKQLTLLQGKLEKLIKDDKSPALIIENTKSNVSENIKPLEGNQPLPTSAKKPLPMPTEGQIRAREERRILNEIQNNVGIANLKISDSDLENQFKELEISRLEEENIALRKEEEKLGDSDLERTSSILTQIIKNTSEIDKLNAEIESTKVSSYELPKAETADTPSKAKPLPSIPQKILTTESTTTSSSTVVRSKEDEKRAELEELLQERKKLDDEITSFSKLSHDDPQKGSITKKLIAGQILDVKIENLKNELNPTETSSVTAPLQQQPEKSANLLDEVKTAFASRKHIQMVLPGLVSRLQDLENRNVTDLTDDEINLKIKNLKPQIDKAREDLKVVQQKIKDLENREDFKAMKKEMKELDKKIESAQEQVDLQNVLINEVNTKKGGRKLLELTTKLFEFEDALKELQDKKNGWPL